MLVFFSLAILFLLPLVTTALNLFPHTPGSPLISSFFGIPGQNATYDYVIVGGGTAGLTLATRLAASPRNLSVAVVEAGNGFYELSNGNLSVVPGYAAWFTGNDLHDWQPGVDWGFKTVKQAFSNRTYHLTRGKTLGGSSARNFMLYQRGTVDSFTKWASLLNDSSYLWSSVLPYYQKSPHYTPYNASLYTNSTNAQDPAAFSQSGGPLQVSFPSYIDSFSTWTQQAFQAFGMALIPGFNSGRLLGSAYATFTIDPTTGFRSSSESSFLASALLSGEQRAPTIYTNTLATRILFTNTSSTNASSSSTTNPLPRATAIHVTTAGTFGTPSLSYTLHARNSIILSAGAIQSPQLLLVSGIGNCTALRALSIPCVAHSPGVGQNLWDHPLFGTSHKLRMPTLSALATNATLAAQAASSFLGDGGGSGSGPLGSSAGGMYAWEKLPAAYNLSTATRARLDAAFPADWPEVEWLPAAAFRGANAAPERGDPRDGGMYATLSTALVAPLSRGSVRLRSRDAGVAPAIDPGWFADAGDVEVAVRAVRRQREVWAWLVERGVAEEEEYFPGGGVVGDEEVVEWLRGSFTTVNHASCTCKMGVRGEDEMAVLDARARVYGVEGLRVVDASSFPLLPPGHPQATVYMLAEKIAEGILEE